MSYMFQGNALFDSLTVYENIALPLLETTNLKKAEIDQRVMAQNRTDRTDRSIAQVSFGTIRRHAKTSGPGARTDNRSENGSL